MHEDDVSRIAASLQTMLPAGWEVSYDLASDGRCVLTARHQASLGLDLDLGTSGAHVAMERLPQVVAAQAMELQIVAAAPALQHVELVLGIRGLTTAFNWSRDEVRGLVSLLEEAGALSHAEARWLGDFTGSALPEAPGPE